jgi:phosphate acetyltransferase
VWKCHISSLDIVHEVTRRTGRVILLPHRGDLDTQSSRFVDNLPVVEGVTIMSNKLYLTTTGPAAGKSAIVLGLMSLLDREARNVGFFRPIGRHEAGVASAIDPTVELICSVFGIDCQPEAMIGVTDRDATDLITSGRYEDLIERILTAYKAYERTRGFVLIEGTNYQGPTVAFEFDINADIARNLGAPVLLVVSGRDRTPEDIYDNAVLSRDAFSQRGCDMLAVIANRVDPNRLDDVKSLLKERLAAADIPFAGAIPEEQILAKPRMDEIASALDAEVLYGEQYLDNLVFSFRIGSMQLLSLLDRVEPGALVITAGDRADILLGLMAAQMSNRTPNLSGLLLSSGLVPTETVDRVVKGLRGTQLPVLAVSTGAYQTAINVSQVASTITPRSFRKIETARILFEQHVDADVLRSGISMVRPERLTPTLFLHGLIERARADRRHIVLPEGSEERILRAVDALVRRQVVEMTVLGDEDAIRDRAQKLNVQLEGVHIVNPANSEALDEYAACYHELRKHKGVTPETARDVMHDHTYFATMMVHRGHADGMVSGSVNTTAHTVRPAFEFIKTQPGIDLVSSVFFMCLSDRVLVYGDCAVVPNPSAEELAQIAVASADTAAAFGIEPRVAMLSYATGTSGSGQDVEKVTRATEMARKLRPDLPIDGPLQYDAAVDAGVAQTKLPDSSVAGRATVFIFPDLNTGNNTYKAVQRSAGAIAVGPVLQGLRKPVNDLSRGCTVPDIVNTVAITAIQAQATRRGQ